MKLATIQEQAARRVFPAFDLANLLKSTFEPRAGQRICILIDLPDPSQMKDFAFLKNPELTIQANAVNFFHKPLHARVMKELGLHTAKPQFKPPSPFTAKPSFNFEQNAI